MSITRAPGLRWFRLSYAFRPKRCAGLREAFRCHIRNVWGSYRAVVTPSPSTLRGNFLAAGQLLAVGPLVVFRKLINLQRKIMVFNEFVNILHHLGSERRRGGDRNRHQDRLSQGLA